MSDLVLIIDNYDSFVYNIAQAIGDLGAIPVVIRNDEITLSGIRRMSPDKIIISPGPGTPERKEDVGVVPDLIMEIGEEGIPILGICLGHQTIGYVFGSKIRKARKVYHGKVSEIKLINKDVVLFSGIANTFNGTRYHSLVIDDIKDPLLVDAVSEDNEIMAIHHNKLNIFGVQFHPESVGTDVGYKIFFNFLKRIM
ncbi:anthranilate synthase component II [Sulfuracidifex metallicus]|uniref:anthranilate synthase component II n=1 Tax=Sulfuracidifex metallicus TaxID=47303 RepID=UPI00227704FF|nr:aminodeoxychorismate/anthranilate synthase component II [Sulfuracidifex metallicus]MCY0850895.1 aminodeoxychorismate/anthranilate synthase component II [Sulfuracidifex metallicus]